MESVGSVRVDSENRTAEAPPTTTPRLQEDSLPPKDAIPAVRKRYNRLKLTVGIIQTVFFFSLSLAVVATAISAALERICREIFENDYLVLLGFSFVLGTMQSILSFPLKFYSTFLIEHKFGLSNQSLGQWLWESAKGVLVGISLVTPILIALYYCVRTFGADWWLPVGVVLFVFSVLLARIAPVLILPLFYKFTPLPESRLRETILALCDRVGMRVSGVYVFNMSKNTKKANAGFTGIGKSKRIILGDTLVDSFTADEVEAVFAHELGHYKLNHIWIGMGAGAVSTFVGLFFTARLYQATLPVFGFSSIDSIAALPLLGVLLGIYSLVTSPLGNMLSRSHERAADRYAVELAGKKEAFVGALRKLASTNLADESPHPLIEFMFYSHPSIQKRIRAIEGI